MKTLSRLACSLITIATTLMLTSSPALAGDVPDPHPKLPPGIQDKINTLLGAGMAIVIAGCVGGVFIVAWKMATAIRHGEISEVAGKLGAVAAACILVGGASGLVGWLYA